MTIITLRNGRSSTVNANRATLPYGRVSRMMLQGTPEKDGLIRWGFGTLLETGATIHSARIVLEQVGQWSDPVSVRLFADDWKIRRVTHENMPARTGSTITATRDGRILTCEVKTHVQTIVDTGVNGGWLVSSTSPTKREIKGFGGDDGAPVLIVDYSYPPTAPTDLTPSGLPASVAKPALQFSAEDFSALQVQVSTTETFATTTFDSGWVTTDLPEYDLASSTFSGFTSTPVYWRVRVRDAAGVTSEWSTAAEGAYAALPAGALAQPGPEVWESSPPLDADMAGLVNARFFVYDNKNALVYDSKKLPTTTGIHTPPRPVFVTEGATYTVVAYLWDDVDRAETPGAPTFREVTTTTTLVKDSTVTGVSDLTATTVVGRPQIRLTFSRAAAPDAVRIRQDGVVIGDDIPYEALIVAGQWHSVDLWTARPNVPNVFAVQAVVNGRASTASTVEIVPRTTSRWLVDPETDEVVKIQGTGGEFFRPEIAVIHEVQDGEHVIRRRFGRRKPEGTILGTLTSTSDNPDLDPEAMAQTLERWAAGDPAKVYRWIYGTENLPVWLGDIVTPTSPATRAQFGDVVKTVSASWWQAD